MMTFNFNSISFQSFLRALEEKFQLPKNELSIIGMLESNGDPNAVSPKKAKGLFQLTDDTSKDFGVNNPFNPFEAAIGAAKKLSSDLNEFGDINLARAAFNSGTQAVKDHGGIPPFKETQNFVVEANRLSSELNSVPQNISQDISNVTDNNSNPELDFNPFLKIIPFNNRNNESINDNLSNNKITEQNIPNINSVKDQPGDNFNPFITGQNSLEAQRVSATQPGTQPGTQFSKVNDINNENNIKSFVPNLREKLKDQGQLLNKNFIFGPPELDEAGVKGIEETLSGPVQTLLESVAPNLAKKFTEFEANRQQDFRERIKTLPIDVKEKIQMRNTLGKTAPTLFASGGGFLRNTGLGGLFDFLKFSEKGSSIPERLKEGQKGILLTGGLDLLLRGLGFTAKEIGIFRDTAKEQEIVKRALNKSSNVNEDFEQIPKFEEPSTEEFANAIADFFRVDAKTAAKTAGSIQPAVKERISALKNASNVLYGKAKTSVENLLDDIVLNPEAALKKYGDSKLVRDTIAQGSIPTPKALSIIEELRAKHLKVNTPEQVDQTFISYLDDLKQSLSAIKVQGNNTIELRPRENIDFDFLRNQITKPNDTIESFYRGKGKDIVPDKRIIEILPLQNAFKEDLRNFASLNKEAVKSLDTANKFNSQSIAPLKSNEILMKLADNATTGDDIVNIIKNVGPQQAQIVYNHLNNKGRSNLVASIIDDAVTQARKGGVFDENTFVQTLQQSEPFTKIALNNEDKIKFDGLRDLMLHVLKLDQPGFFGSLFQLPVVSVFLRSAPGIRVTAAVNRFRNKPGTPGFADELNKFTPQIVQFLSNLNEANTNDKVRPPRLIERPTRPVERPQRPG